ncbi:putative amine oxidase [copper-containing] [Ruditapes philippinarum]|uniref:putative amine oxidase [copper-containing] n=1 Tax=Ruditapes philippinarum TaxID=129788 RepID=UPI00295BB224|nr:putative amine oxidase [copper-containing] [Ruditapes philippinarum]
MDSGPKGASAFRVFIVTLVILGLTCTGLLISLLVTLRREGDENFETVPCSIDEIFKEDLEAEVPGVFDDLTNNEIKGLKNYLYEKSGLDLVRPSANKSNANYVFVAELYLPNKAKVIAHLDNKENQPEREAKVIIIRGKQPNTEINELVVGPLPNATYHKPLPGINASLPYFYRPMTEADYGSVTKSITDQVHEQLGDLIQTCYGAKLKDCENKCIGFLYASSFSPASSGEQKRKTWYWLTYVVEYYTLHTVDFTVLANIKETGVEIEVVWFKGNQYKSMNDLSSLFRNKSVKCVPQTFPTVDKNLFSTLHRRGNIPETAKNKRSPVFVQPDGQRYTVKGRHVNYMQWSFDFRLSTSYGPQVYDIKFGNERIIYELGLQEISVFYSGYSPQQRFSDFLDSVELIGPSAQGLIPGVDCPNHATYYNTKHITETSETADVTKNVFCLFELNTGEPLRRHHSYYESEGKFYEGIENVFLVLRTIITVANYDYILDFRFYQNGVVEVKSMSTGFALTNAFSEMEKKYGFQLHDNIVASFHTHMFHFKADLDVKGQNNRYETIDIKTETTPNEFSRKINSTYSQGYLERSLKLTEKDAAYKFNFQTPKYHIFYNNKTRDTYGNPPAYRLIHNGMVKQIIPEGHNKEPSISWARYQHAVTKRKDTEAHSSSMYSMFDTDNQVVNFQGYIDDDENITDEDLVLWVTLGAHHIPHKEDLPLTTTMGLSPSFILQPYNYFPEDPAMASPNAVRIEPRNSGVYIERYGMSYEPKNICVPRKTNFENKIKSDTELIFEN